MARACTAPRAKSPALRGSRRPRRTCDDGPGFKGDADLGRGTRSATHASHTFHVVLNRRLSEPATLHGIMMHLHAALVPDIHMSTVLMSKGSGGTVWPSFDDDVGEVARVGISSSDSLLPV